MNINGMNSGRVSGKYTAGGRQLLLWVGRGEIRQMLKLFVVRTGRIVYCNLVKALLPECF